MKKKYYESLDGLRAIAVMIVLFAHANIYIKSGGVGVDIFFVLSGFLITGLLSNEMLLHNSINFKNFYAKRFLRLSPCLIIVCLAYSAWHLLKQNTFPLKEIIIALTYTGNYARAIYSINLHGLNHVWSLACEEQFYLIWPIVILVLETYIKSLKQKAILLLMLSFGIAIYRFSLVGHVSAARIYFALDTHMDGLILGSFLSYHIKIIQNMKKVPSIYGKILSYLLVPSSILTLLLLILFLNWPSPLMGKYGFFVAAVASSIIITDLVIGKFSILKVVLEHKILVYIGKISYGLYLWHAILYYIIDLTLVQSKGIVKVPIKLTLSIVVASISYYYFEVRFLKLKKYFEPNSTQNNLVSSSATTI
ncbi:hypothetical protein GCM10028808_45750 [Spirosoma migulaei]